MSKKNKNKMVITKEQIYVLNRKSRRAEDMGNQKPFFKHKAHKMATDYNRQQAKKITE